MLTLESLIGTGSVRDACVRVCVCACVPDVCREPVSIQHHRRYLEPGLLGDGEGGGEVEGRKGTMSR